MSKTQVKLQTITGAATKTLQNKAIESGSEFDAMVESYCATFGDKATMKTLEAIDLEKVKSVSSARNIVATIGDIAKRIKKASKGKPVTKKAVSKANQVINATNSVVTLWNKNPDLTEDDMIAIVKSIETVQAK